ncbi:hypothetical protein KY366_06920 [Candidatus Woesearchaeota archaeon]|nr:hypothetical protein [Candidatus Woesearchaeota archaeon]
MEKIRFPCPCGGKIRWTKEKVIQSGVDCGVLDVEICDRCGNMYLPDDSMKSVEKKLKERGLWGTKRREVKFWKSGNSVTVRFPTDMTHELGLDRVKKGFAYQDGENKLTIEY